MKRWMFYSYGVTCHLLFFATFAYLLGFVGNVLVPKSIDSAPTGSVAAAVAIDLLLIAVFALQHSVMARPAFKRIWTRIIPQPIERSTYVLISCIVTILLIWQWQAIDVVIWDVQHPLRTFVAVGCYSPRAGCLVPVVSLMIDHFDLFGTRQVWLLLARPRVHARAVPHADALQSHPSPALCRVGHGLLGDADDDPGPPPVRCRDDDLHGRGGLLRGARPGRTLWPTVRGLPAAGTDDLATLCAERIRLASAPRSDRRDQTR